MPIVNGKNVGLLEFSKTFLDRETARDQFTKDSEYRPGNKFALSPIGKGENNGQIGDTADIDERNREIARNRYSSNNQYDASKV
jgi:hypothetical protein